MSHFTGYGAYMLFLALRTHFNNAKYDFFQFKGKIKSTKETFNRRHDRYFFEKIAKEYHMEQLRDFYVANLLVDKHYITELINDSAVETFTQYISRRQSLSYNFTNELDQVFRCDASNPFMINNNVYPHIVTLYLHGIVSPETIIITNDFIPFFAKFDKYLGETDPIWSKISLKLTKYRPFLKYERDKFKRILREKINDTRGDSIRDTA